MKRALFCVWMVLALGWCTAWAETDWPPMTAEVTEDERFSIVEEGETRFLRYERKQGDTWATIWENDAILPDGELGWIYIDSSPGGGEWVTKWFIRKVGPQVSVCASWRREAEYEDFVVGLEKQQSGTWVWRSTFHVTKGAYMGKNGITRDRTGKPWYYRNSKR